MLLMVALDRFGPTKSIVRLALGIDRRRFDVMVCTCVTGGPPDVLRALAEASVPVRSLNMAGPFDLRALWRLTRLLRQERIDVVHARVQRAAFYGRIAARIAGVPLVIVNVVNMYSNHFQSQHGRWIGRILALADAVTLPLCDLVVANGASAAEDFLTRARFHPARVVTIPNGVDAERFAPNYGRGRDTRATLGYDDRHLIVGCVSRLVPLKNIDSLIDAVALLAPRRPELRLLLVGDGVERSHLEAQAAPLGDRVRFLGERQDIPELLRAMDMFAFPSTSEGQPNAVLEAMAAGLPVVAGEIAPLAELVTHQTTGLLVPLTPTAFADAIDKLAADRDNAVRLGAAGRDRAVRQFSITEMIHQFERLYCLDLRQTARAVTVS